MNAQRVNGAIRAVAAKRLCVMWRATPDHRDPRCAPLRTHRRADGDGWHRRRVRDAARRHMLHVGVQGRQARQGERRCFRERARAARAPRGGSGSRAWRWGERRVQWRSGSTHKDEPLGPCGTEGTHNRTEQCAINRIPRLRAGRQRPTRGRCPHPFVRLYLADSQSNSKPASRYEAFARTKNAPRASVTNPCTAAR